MRSLLIDNKDNFATKYNFVFTVFIHLFVRNWRKNIKPRNNYSVALLKGKVVWFLYSININT